MDNLIHADCLDAMAAMDAESIDAIVTDPPYGLEFMGKKWDRLGDIGQMTHSGIPDRDGSTVFGRTRVSYSGSANRKCRACNSWEWDYPERKCSCEKPDFPNVKALESRRMQDWHEAWAREAFRIAKPGAHLLAFGGTRTVHRLAAAIEDAGWEIRDMLVWGYASGFPKSLDVSKAIDRAAGAEREVTGVSPFEARRPRAGDGATIHMPAAGDITAPATPDAEKWNGWGTALKPAWEPIVMARKPLRGTVAANVLRHGTGALNIAATRISGGPTTTIDAWENDANLCVSCAVDADSPERLGTSATVASITPRIAEPSPSEPATSGATSRAGTGFFDGTTEASTATSSSTAGSGRTSTGRSPSGTSSTTSTATSSTTASSICISCGEPITPGTIASAIGRWPSNLVLTDPIFDGGVEGVVGGGETTVNNASTRGLSAHTYGGGNGFTDATGETVGYGDSGTYSRFFLVPKSSRSDREPVINPDGHDRTQRFSTHPTQKPTALMRHLVRLVTPPGGTVLDPFLGSGTTALAAEMEGFAWIGIEKEAEYVAITEARLNGTQRGLGLGA